MTTGPDIPPRKGTPPDELEIPPELLIRKGVRPLPVRPWWVKLLPFFIVGAMVAISVAVAFVRSR